MAMTPQQWYPYCFTYHQKLCKYFCDPLNVHGDYSAVFTWILAKMTYSK